MNSYVEKTEENRIQVVSHTFTKKRKTSAVDLSLTDRHPVNVAQMQVQEIANNSPQVQKAKQLQAAANTYSALLVPNQGIEKAELIPDEHLHQEQTDRAPRLTRSNSIDRQGLPLAISERNTSSTALSRTEMKDFSVIAVFSREAFENFGIKWKDRMNDEPSELATMSSKKEISDEDATKLLSLQSRTDLGTDFQAQVQALLENKTSPHVIAVIEGKEEMSSLSVKTKVGDDLIDVPYTHITYIQGKNTKGSNDNKQSMSVYVRDDMTSVYSFSKEKIIHDGGKEINAVGVNYATSDGLKYRSLVVHIPNEFIKTGVDRSKTHASFQNYARNERDNSSPVIVTSYFGDTNYASEMEPYSSPSMGGHSSNGRTLSPQSSGAQNETHFMQSVPLNEGRLDHSVLQPSALNYVFINPNAASREATDHPSIMQYVAHAGELVGKVDTDALRPLEYV
ncbi:hypothetical protein [Pedobacter gandavensis]|uniref:hypothetical protein n=1 Tax=Pedobacter gandavensis TaxID=2679963 RepID=UPI00292F8CE3|nr:hypothetical protein [Pedobacter gandavensis]